MFDGSTWGVEVSTVTFLENGWNSFGISLSDFKIYSRPGLTGALKSEALSSIPLCGNSDRIYLGGVFTNPGASSSFKGIIHTFYWTD